MRELKSGDKFLFALEYARGGGGKALTMTIMHCDFAYGQNGHFLTVKNLDLAI